MRDALKKQELDLAEMQKTALEKTRLADEKLPLDLDEFVAPSSPPQEG